MKIADTEKTHKILSKPPLGRAIVRIGVSAIASKGGFIVKGRQEMKAENELGVIVVFSQGCRERGIEIVSIRSGFPDAVVLIDEVEYSVEFEYTASNFRSHKHDIRKCDLIICWENDWSDCILPVIEVKNENWTTNFDVPTKGEREAFYWKERALLAEKKLKAIQNSPPTRVPEQKPRNLAAEIFADEPNITGAELGRRIGMSERSGQNILIELKESMGHPNGNGTH